MPNDLTRVRDLENAARDLETAVDSGLNSEANDPDTSSASSANSETVPSSPSANLPSTPDPEVAPDPGEPEAPKSDTGPPPTTAETISGLYGTFTYGPPVLLPVFTETSLGAASFIVGGVANIGLKINKLATTDFSDLTTQGKATVIIDSAASMGLSAGFVTSSTVAIAKATALKPITISNHVMYNSKALFQQAGLTFESSNSSIQAVTKGFQTATKIAKAAKVTAVVAYVFQAGMSIAKWFMDQDDLTGKNKDIAIAQTVLDVTAAAVAIGGVIASMTVIGAPIAGVLYAVSALLSIGSAFAGAFKDPPPIYFTGTDGDDNLTGNEKNNHMSGHDGNDVISGGAGHDWIFGGDGDDTLHGGAGTDWLYGERGDDLLTGGTGNDTLDGGGGNDRLHGQAGDDILHDYPGQNTMDGGDDNDTLNLMARGHADNERQITVMLGRAGDDEFRVHAEGGRWNGDWVTSQFVPWNVLQVPRAVISPGEGNDTIKVLLNFRWGDVFADVLVNYSIDDSDKSKTWSIDLEAGYAQEVKYATTRLDSAYTRSIITILKEDPEWQVIRAGEMLHVWVSQDRSLHNPLDMLFSRPTLSRDTFLNVQNVKGGDGNDVIYGSELSTHGRYYIYGGKHLGFGKHIELGHNVLYGGQGHDFIFGRSGNDTLYGDEGNDRLAGGVGRDTLYGGVGHDRLSGGVGHDTLHGDEGNDRLSGGVGHDTLHGGVGHDRLYGRVGNDRLNGGAGNDRLYGGDDNDMLRGGAGEDRLYGGAGDDGLRGGAGEDHLFGGAGDDFIYAEGDTDKLDGGTGSNTLTYKGASGVDISGWSDTDRYTETEMRGYRIDLLAPRVGVNDGSALTDSWNIKYETIANFMNAVGSRFGDHISGTDGANQLFGGKGNDVLHGRGGNDHLHGGTGADRLYGGAGDDIFYAFGDGDFFDGGANNDTLSLAQIKGDKAVYVDLLMNKAALSQYALFKDGWSPTFDWEASGVVFDSLNSIENVSGSRNRDVIRGNNETNILIGGAGNDSIRGEGGNDIILGQVGNDRLYGGAGEDVILGGDGKDRIHGGADADRLFGGDNDDRIIGGGGDDRLYGGIGNDRLDGGADDDHLDGGAGRDLLIGGDGNDVFVASGDGDRFYGKAGIDVITNESLSTDQGVDVRLQIGRGTLRNGNDELFDQISGIENVVGTSKADRIAGDRKNNILTGEDGDDKLMGKGGNDTLFGGKGNDTLMAGRGDDILDGGEGRDILIGSRKGSDTFVLSHLASSFDVADVIYRYEIYRGDSNPGDTIRLAKDVEMIWYRRQDVNGDGKLDTVLYNNAEGRADVEGGGIYAIIDDFSGILDPENFSNGHETDDFIYPALIQ